MTDPVYQAWRTITPVEGEPIPDGAEFRHPGEKRYHPAYRGERWNGWPVCLKWRVPVPVIPESVAVDAVMHNAFEVNGDNSWIVEIDGQREYRANTKEQLRELVIAKLRELSQEKTDATN